MQQTSKDDRVGSLYSSLIAQIYIKYASAGNNV